jgi:hypothetical protein
MNAPPVPLPPPGRTGLVVDRIPDGVRVTPVFRPDPQDGDPAQTITLSRSEALRMAWELVKLAARRTSQKETP